MLSTKVPRPETHSSSVKRLGFARKKSTKTFGGPLTEGDPTPYTEDVEEAELRFGNI